MLNLISKYPIFVNLYSKFFFRLFIFTIQLKLFKMYKLPLVENFAFENSEIKKYKILRKFNGGLFVSAMGTRQKSRKRNIKMINNIFFTIFIESLYKIFIVQKIYTN